MKNFINAYNAFYGEKLSYSRQLTKISLSGQELQEFCEFYIKEHSNGFESEHESEKKVIRLLYFSIGFVIGLIAFLIRELMVAI